MTSLYGHVDASARARSLQNESEVNVHAVTSQLQAGMDGSLLHLEHTLPFECVEEREKQRERGHTYATTHGHTYARVCRNALLSAAFVRRHLNGFNRYKIIITENKRIKMFSYITDNTHPEENPHHSH